MKDIYRRALGDMGCFTVFTVLSSPLIALSYFEGGYGPPKMPGALGILVIFATIITMLLTGRHLYATFESIAARARPQRFIRKLTPKNAARLTFAVIATIVMLSIETVIGGVAAVIAGFTIGTWWAVLDFRDDGYDEPVEQDSDVP